MCLTVNKLTKPEKADQEYYVYKIMDSNLISWHYNFQYKLGKKYMAKFDRKPHSTIFGTKEYNKGLHYYSTLERVKKEDWLGGTVVRCIMPKGTMFIENQFETGVCDCLIIDKIIKK